MRRKPSRKAFVIGGGPGGSTVATFLARGGLRVAVAERETFPRFHVGESLLPAMMPVLDRLGIRERVERHGFLIKFGAAFHDQESDLEYRFYFREGKPWPPYSYEVQRSEFDQILLEHAAKEPGVSVLQPAEVERVELDEHGATLGIREGGEARTIRARFVVAATASSPPATWAAASPFRAWARLPSSPTSKAPRAGRDATRE